MRSNVAYLLKRSLCLPNLLSCLVIILLLILHALVIVLQLDGLLGKIVWEQFTELYVSHVFAISLHLNQIARNFLHLIALAALLCLILDSLLC